jgi:CRP/FNR family cyclic AMP-dependent transcriptional regulator
MRTALMMFGTLNDADIEWFAEAGRLRRFAPGEAIIVERQSIDVIMIVLDGLAVVTAGGVTLTRVAAGDLLGEVSLVDTRLPTASVTADTETTALLIDRSALRARLHADAGFAGRFYHALAIVLAQRLRRNTPGATPEDIDDLDEELLANLTLAGLRFDQLLRRSLGTA